ncbi:hypothetical protein [Pseudomonas sp. R5(2019)]|uniref:hypothetical protein n=1 Tax=Pseudomonas sp. R5(2019) TaxID=2697566 RepID=UPI001412DF48|nr:hypothetical protein [Pseudomonas sp. R5(2019)]NBA96940.1 hypothetical protein [Pseudomonas sp. R5(2019)]
MNRQSLAQWPITPLLLRQGLFATLSLLLTLIAGQQYQAWQFDKPPLPIEQRTAIVSQYSPVSVHASQLQGTKTSVLNRNQTLEQRPSQRWVF